MEKISAVYKIVNMVTGDSYVGSSKNVKRRWLEHKRPQEWNRKPNNSMYQDMQKYGLDKFRLQILAPVMPEYLTQVEQEFIEMLRPTYNNYRAKGVDVKRQKETHRKWKQSDKGKESNRKYQQSDRGKEACRKASKKYKQSEKCKEYNRKYRHQLCSYMGETLTLCALAKRFRKAGIENPTLEAKKYLLES